MEKLPKIGQRVRGPHKWDKSLKITGTVIGIRPEIIDIKDDPEHSFEMPFDPRTWKAVVRVDDTVENWPEKFKRIFTTRILNIEDIEETEEALESKNSTSDTPA